MTGVRVERDVGVSRPPATAPSAVPVEMLLLQRRAVSRAVAQTAGRERQPFADPAASRDSRSAAAALDAYLALAVTDRRKYVEAADKRSLARVLAALSRTDQLRTYSDALREIGRWVQEQATRAAAGMTDEQIADTQREFLEQTRASFGRRFTAAAKARGKLVDEAIAKAPSRAETAVSAARGAAAIEKVVEYARSAYPELALETAHIRLAFEEQGFGGVAFSEPDGAGGRRAAVGREFVELAELDPAYALSTVVHEIAGHPEYGLSDSVYHLALYDRAKAKLPPRRYAASDAEVRLREAARYGYPESEIYALLREVPYRPASNSVDAAHLSPGALGLVVVPSRADVAVAIEDMREAWSPKLIVALLRGCRARLAVDPRITPPALQAFDDAVLLHFDAATLRRIRD